MRAILFAAALLCVAGCNRRGDTPLIRACMKGDTARVTKLLSEGAAPDACNPYGESPLMWAATFGDDEMIRALLARRVDVNRCSTRSGGQFCALIAASGLGRMSAMRLLLDAGAEPDRDCRGFETPLYIAAHNGHPDAVTMLIRAGADVRRGAPDSTYIMRILGGANPQALEALVRAGCPIDAQSSDTGETALMRAADDDESMVAELLRLGANPNLRDHSGGTALHHAVRGAIEAAQQTWSPGVYRTTIVSRLLAAGADPNAVDEDRESARSLSRKAGKYESEIVAMLDRAKQS